MNIGQVHISFLRIDVHRIAQLNLLLYGV